MEVKIVKGFIKKNRQERFTFNLKKRLKKSYKKPFHDYAYSFQKLNLIIDESVIAEYNEKFLEIDEITAKMQQNGVDNLTYVLSYENTAVDRTHQNLDEMIRKFHKNIFETLIVGLPSGFSFLILEGYGGFNPNYFLKPNFNFEGGIR